MNLINAVCRAMGIRKRADILRLPPRPSGEDRVASRGFKALKAVQVAACTDIFYVVAEIIVRMSDRWHAVLLFECTDRGKVAREVRSEHQKTKCNLTKKISYATKPRNFNGVMGGLCTA
jgi:hypothetical protein